MFQGRAHTWLHVHLSQRGAEDGGARRTSEGLPHQPSSWGENTERSVCVSLRAQSLTPVCVCVCVCVQPEAIAGSSRMKGGSATKILLEVVLSAAHAATFANTPVTDE